MNVVLGFVTILTELAVAYAALPLLRQEALASVLWALLDKLIVEMIG